MGQFCVWIIRYCNVCVVVVVVVFGWCWVAVMVVVVVEWFWVAVMVVVVVVGWSERA